MSGIQAVTTRSVFYLFLAEHDTISQGSQVEFLSSGAMTQHASNLRLPGVQVQDLEYERCQTAPYTDKVFRGCAESF